MRLKRLMILCMAASLGLLCGCNSSGGAAGKSLVLKAGFSTSASDPRVVATELFKEEVEKATDGRIKVEIHTDGELGSDSDLISGVVNGEVDMTASSAGNFANYAPDAGISAFPFLFDDFEEAWAFVDGDVEVQAEQALADNNIKVLGHYDNGFRCVTTSAKVGPVNSVSDMEGLVIRTPENQVVMQTMYLLGAEPKVLEFAKLKDALAKGEFDAQENLAITNHSYDVMLFVIRQDIWDDLSKEDQEILTSAAAKAQAKDRELVKNQTEEYVQKLQEAGMTVTYPDLNEFKKATAEAVDYFANTYNTDLLKQIQ